MAQTQPDRAHSFTESPSLNRSATEVRAATDAIALFPPTPAFAQHTALPGEVHLRLVDLDDGGWDKLSGFLSVDEELRVSRYPTVARGTAYQRARAALRLVLAYYARKPPRSLVFDYESTGKPFLRGYPLHFSVGRSEHLALIAVAPAAVGVDLEWIGQARVSFGEQLVQTMTDGERRRLDAMTISDRHRALCQLWTDREARRKAVGAPAGAHQASDQMLAEGGKPLTLQPLHCIPHFAASVCAAGAGQVQWY